MSLAIPPEVAGAQDLLDLIRLAAMDGYNKNPVATVDDWVEECKKRIFLLYAESVVAQPADDTYELLAKAYTKIGSLEDFEEMKKDRIRLDWIIEKGAKVDESNSAAEDGEPWMCRHRTFHTSFQGEVHYIYGASARDAIDKAMAMREQ